MEAPSATHGQGMDAEISATGYADDTYGLGISLPSLQGALEHTQLWLCLTGQDVNGKKSVAFTTEKKSSTLGLIISGASIPEKEEFKCLGVGIRTHSSAKTGPLLAGRMKRAGELLSRKYGV